MNSLFFFLASVGLVWLLCLPIQRELLRRELIDRPNARSSHQIPTPRGGGIAIIAVIVTGLVATGSIKGSLLLYILAGAAVLLAVVSFLDDISPLPARIRFAVHSLAAVTVLFALSREYSLPFADSFRVPGLALLFLWIVGYTNAFNFMDGINGISSVQASITGLGSVLVVGFAEEAWSHPLQISSVLVAGAALGFLPHNFPKASMFMGDVGSAPLGFLLSGLTLALAAEFGWHLLPAIALLHANYVLDTSITLVRRLRRGERVYQAHKEHFYQRLVRAGKSHAFVTGWELGLQAVTLGLALAYVRVPELRWASAVGVIGIWIGFFGYSELLFRRFTTLPTRAAMHPAESHSS